MFQRLTAPVTELDEERLRAFAASLPEATPMAEADARRPTTVVGEIRSVRIVPRAGSPSLEVTVSDGTASVLAVWVGRRRIAGVSPGRRLVITGRGGPSPAPTRLLFFNPEYQLL